MKLFVHQILQLLGTYLVVAQRDFASTFGTATNVAIIADVSDAIRKLCFEANMTGRFQLDACLFLLLRLLSYRVDKRCHLVLFPPVQRKFE